MSLRLYGRYTSGNTFKTRLAISLMDIPHEFVLIDRKGHVLQRTPDLMRGNSRGLIPKLEVDGKVIWDSTAILVYLARRFGGERWLPIDPDGMAEVTQWLALAQNEVLFGVAYARSITAGRRQGDLEKTRALGQVALRTMEDRLSRFEWLALDHMTIADCACYPHVAVCHEGGISLDEYPGTTRWIDRIKSLPNYIDMPGAERKPA
jgi:glutathione S-transferase